MSMTLNYLRHFSLGNSIALAIPIVLPLSFVLFNYGCVYAANDTVNNTKNYNQIDDKVSYVIKYNAGGGFIGRHDYILYNSTTNHLISNYKANNSLYDLGLSKALFDLQLTYDQQKQLSKLIEDGNFFNTSFNNKEPSCCDIGYYELDVITPNKMNSVRWTSLNIGGDAKNERLPTIVTTIVDTLEKYSANSSLLYSESKLTENTSRIN